MQPQMTTRREFLSATGAAVTAAFLPGLAIGNDKLSKTTGPTFGFSLYGMRSLPVVKALKVCRGIGYDAVELVANKDWPCDPRSLSPARRKEIRNSLNDLGLQLSALMENVHLTVDDKKHKQNLDRLKRAAELGHALSPKSPPVMETVLGGRPNQWEKLKRAMAKRLRDWAKVAESTKTTIAIKAHVGGALHTPTDAAWLMKSAMSPRIRLAYDYSHFQLWDFELTRSLTTMIDNTVFIHVKDSKGKRGKFRFTLPGEGSIDYAKYFALLKQRKYTGPIVVEVSGQIHGQKGYDPIAVAKTSYANLAPKLKAAGIWKEH